MDPIAVLDAHIPHLTEKAEAQIDLVYLGAGSEGLDYADAAVRECRCGVMIDGFYEYVDHLKAQLAPEKGVEVFGHRCSFQCIDAGKHVEYRETTDGNTDQAGEAGTKPGRGGIRESATGGAAPAGRG